MVAWVKRAFVACRRAEGENLPPPPKTAIAGPEYFGLTHPDVMAQIEALDCEGLCTAYWAGKEVPHAISVSKGCLSIMLQDSNH